MFTSAEGFVLRAYQFRRRCFAPAAIGCFTERFEELARRTNRPATLDLYVDLLKGEPQVAEQAQAIDDALPGE